MAWAAAGVAIGAAIDPATTEAATAVEDFRKSRRELDKEIPSDGKHDRLGGPCGSTRASDSE